jgi:AsmA protein
LRIALANVRVRNRGTELAFAEEVKVAIPLVSLLRQELHYDSIELNRARISIERDRDGNYNYESPPGTKKPFRVVELPNATLTDLVVAYIDKGSGSGFEAGKCQAEMTNMRHPGGAEFLARLSFSGQFTCSEVRGKDANVSDLKFSVEATDGVFDFKPITMRVFGGQGAGSMRMDRSTAVPGLQLSYSLSGFHVEELFKGLSIGKSLSGTMDFSTTLSMQGRTRGELRRSANGEMSLSGTNLTLAGVDLDRDLSKYVASQNFNLFDVSALLLAGPIGLGVTKGYEFAGLAQQTGGSTQIRNIVSTWKVENGVAHAKDVALATRDNRLALKGGLDFVHDEYDEVFVALVDSNGCASVRQRIRGPFGKPVLEKPSVLASMAGPLLNLFGRARDLVPGARGKCVVFYNGSVVAPG